jgi:putative membrane protein insertion efficiency factor
MKKLAVLLIRFYQAAIRPVLPTVCRYSPSCSQYAIEAVEKYGFLKGIFLGTRRIMRCHPWGGKGYDPVP